MRIKNLFRLIILVSVFLLFLFFSSSISFLTDWLFFVETGYQQVFLKTLTTQTGLGVGVFISVLIFLLINFLIAAKRTKTAWFFTIPKNLLGRQIDFDSKNTRKLIVIISILIAAFSGLIASSFWQEVLEFLAATPFGIKDPIFNKDIAFYFFSLPVFSAGLSLLKTALMLALIISIVIYTFQGAIPLINLRSKSISLKTISLPVRAHLGILIILWSLIALGTTYLTIHKLVISENNLLFGATYTDITIRLPLMRISMAVFGLVSLSSLLFILSGRIAPFLLMIVLSIVLNFLQGFIPNFFQQLIVEPNQLVKETLYLKHNIAATREAYGLKDIEERKISTEGILTADDLENHELTLKNVRLWDREPLLSTFSQIQEIRTYYQFSSITNDRYNLNGELRQTMLSPRELDSESLPNKNWINQHLIFTHGYGIVAGPVNQVTKEGLPVLFVKDLPPKSDKPELKVSRPEIYYGDRSNDYAIVKTKLKEFDYPKGEENVYTRYQGKGGVVLNSLPKKLLYALNFGSSKFILSNDITRESRLLYYRQIRERVAKIAPFLTYDSDPYLVIAEGKLYWIIDAYTTSDRYPYSQPIKIFNNKVINYMKNSVKVVIDAYDGSVTFYQVDNNDPIIRIFKKIYPNLFHDLSLMPAALKQHIRYPEDIFTVQAAIYTTYHMQDSQIFYNREDQWEVAAIAENGGAQTSITPRHLIMRLPGEQREEYILMQPFSPKAKDNLSAWMAARNDGEQYGKLVVFRFPKDRLVFGPQQIIGRINQDPEISKQISLWDQRGSQVIQGPLLVIPIEASLLYIRPLYLKAETGKIPELKRVIIAYEDTIVMEETLEKGLNILFKKPSQDEKSSIEIKEEKIEEKQEVLTEDKGELIQRAVELYDAALQAQREGDWKKYGEEIDLLGELLRQIKE